MVNKAKTSSSLSDQTVEISSHELDTQSASSRLGRLSITAWIICMILAQKFLLYIFRSSWMNLDHTFFTMEYFASSKQSHPGGPRIPCLVTADTAIPKDPATFHAFPAEVGWKLHHDYRLEPHQSRSPSQGLVPFLQSWLFFGLVLSTIQVDHYPFLQRADLECDGLLDTRKLERRLESWVICVLERPESGFQRQAEIAYMLSTAKKVVRRNYALNIFTKRVGDGPSQEDTQEAFHELALLLMVLGEKLSITIKQVMDLSGDRREIAYDDLDDGWGPSNWTFSKMEKDGWCPRHIRFAHNYFGPYATPLLSTYMTSERRDSSPAKHKECTEHVCSFEKSQRVPGLHSSGCLPDCKHKDTDNCEITGPDMSAIMDHLINSSFSSQTGKWSGIPVLRFRSKPKDGPESIELEVHLIESNDILFEQVVAVSHACDDGWGNGRLNKLPSCRLRYLQRTIQSIIPGENLYFWLDTLIVPSIAQEGDSRRGEARENAMSQVIELFQQARFTILLDYSLPDSTTRRSPTTVAESLLNHGWMDHLWELQGKYMTAEKNDSGEGSNPAGSRIHLDQLALWRHGLRSLVTKCLTFKSGRSSTIASVKQTPPPEWHISSENSEEPNESGIEMDRSIILVANGWQVAKWEVSQPSSLAFGHRQQQLQLLLDAT